MAIEVHDAPLVVEGQSQENEDVSPEIENEIPEGEISPEGTEVVADDKGDDASIDTDLDGDTTDEEPEGDVTFTYDGLEVNVGIPDDLREQFAEKDLNIDDIVKELYDGEFGLSEDSKAKLSEVYGKTIVDSYLDGVKARNDLFKSAHDKSISDNETANEELWNTALTQVGGEDNWNKFEAYAQDKFTDDEFDEFNAVMNSGSAYSQKLAIADVMSRYSESEGDDQLDIIDGSSITKESNNEALSQADYLSLFKSGEYSRDPSKYDNMRRKGQQLGI